MQYERGLLLSRESSLEVKFNCTAFCVGEIGLQNPNALLLLVVFPFFQLKRERKGECKSGVKRSAELVPFDEQSQSDVVLVFFRVLILPWSGSDGICLITDCLI